MVAPKPHSKRRSNTLIQFTENVAKVIPRLRTNSNGRLPKVPCDSRATAVDHVDGLTTLHKRQLCWVITLGITMILYFGFHRIRGSIPDGIIRGSFPSLLAPIVLFSVVELQSDIRFHSPRKKFGILLATTVVAAVWFELVVPMFYKTSVGEIYDVYAMFVGFAVYWGLQSIIGRT